IEDLLSRGRIRGGFVSNVLPAMRFKRFTITLVLTTERSPSMKKRHFTALAALSVMMLAAPRIGQAQKFKVEKFDIKGDGGTDYVAAEPGTGRVFVSRGTHMRRVDGRTGQVLHDIP